MISLRKYFLDLTDLITGVETVAKLEEFGELLISARKDGRRLLLFGNGAAASICSHAALDFTKQGGLESLCFHDPALITAFANDFGYENVIKEIIRAYGRPNDIVVFLSVSGESPNIIEGVKYAKTTGYNVVGFSGRNQNNSLAQLSDTSFWVDSHAYNIVENCHSSWLLSLVDYLIGASVYEVS